MIQGKIWDLHDDKSLRKIEDAAFKILTRNGAEVRHEYIIKLLGEAGCKVDKDRFRVCFTEKLILEAIKNFGSLPDFDVNIPEGWTPANKTATGGSFPHFLDWPSCKRQLADVKAVTDNIKMAHMLPEFEAVGKAMTCSQIDQRIEPIWYTVKAMELTNKPIGPGEVMYAENIKHLVRLGEIYSGKSNDACFVVSCDFSVSPLRFGRRALECMIEKSKYKVKHVPGTMPISGVSGPVTIAGTAALALAELMAGWAIYYLLDPEIPAGGITSTGSLDMQTGLALFGSPEALLQDLTVVQIARRFYGITVNAAYSYVDAKTPGIGATFEKFMPLMTFPFEGNVIFSATGLLSAGQDYSPVQQLLELDIKTAISRFLGTYEISEKTLAVDLLGEVSSQPGKTFLDTTHTLDNYKKEQWYSKWLTRSTWQGDGEAEKESEYKMMENIDNYRKNAVKNYKKPAIDQARVKEANKVLELAEEEKEFLEERA